MNRISENLRRVLAFMAALVILVFLSGRIYLFGGGRRNRPGITISTPEICRRLLKLCV